MKTRSRSNLWALLVGALVLGLGLEVSLAQGGGTTRSASGDGAGADLYSEVYPRPQHGH